MYEMCARAGATTMDAMDASGASDVEAASDTCSAKACALPATITCERCGRRFCAAHCGELVLQRRDDTSKRPAHQGMLERLPTHTESYMLCSPCRTKPVPRDIPPLTQRPSLPKGGAPGAHNRNVVNRWADVWTVDDQ